MIQVQHRHRQWRGRNKERNQYQKKKKKKFSSAEVQKKKFSSAEDHADVWAGLYVHIQHIQNRYALFMSCGMGPQWPPSARGAI